jgi:hypothetical protein
MDTPVHLFSLLMCGIVSIQQVPKLQVATLYLIYLIYKKYKDRTQILLYNEQI